MNQIILAQSSATVVQPHQFRDSVLTEGPTHLPHFRAHKWCFQVRGNNSVRLTFHQFDNELEISEKLKSIDIVQYNLI